MKHGKDKIIGIVGGMGPQAGVALLESITRFTEAATDQEHLPAILMSFPGWITDRTAFLEGHVNSNPAYTIAGIIKKLESAGAEVIGIACNTSHAPRIYNVVMDELQNSGSKARLVNMPYETCKHIKDNYPQASRVGVMCTNGTYRSGIYRDLLRNMGFEAVIPDQSFQNDVIHRMVYDPEFGIKSNTGGITKQVRSLMREALAFFEESDTDALILGCTEFSLIPSGSDEASAGEANMIIADSTEILAKSLIREARATVPMASDVLEYSCFKL